MGGGEGGVRQEGQVRGAGNHCAGVHHVIIVIIMIIVLMLIKMKIFNWRSMIVDKKTVHSTIKTNLQAAESGDEDEEEEEEAEDSEWKTV